MDAKDVELLRVAQHGLLVCSRPYRVIAEQLGLSEQEVLDRLSRLVEKGYIRRVAASIAHYNIGMTANALCAWCVEDDRVDEVGRMLASFEEVTHCYQRERADGWRYNLYTMVHARTREEGLAIVSSLARKVKVDDYVVLFSTRELKKTGVRL